MKQLLESGVHFGHQAHRWNPKMKRFIFMERNGIHIIDLQQTLSHLEDAYGFVRAEAKRANMHYVNQRWLGGFLTNFVTIQRRIARYNELFEKKERGEFSGLPKKEAQGLEDELTHLDRVFQGVKDLRKLPGVLFVVDPHREHIAVAEARRLEIPIVAMVDTNCDPDLIDHIIPANDDAIRAVKLICQKVADAVLEGRAEYEATRKEGAAEAVEAPTPAALGLPRARRTPRVYEPDEEEEAQIEEQLEVAAAVAAGEETPPAPAPEPVAAPAPDTVAVGVASRGVPAGNSVNPETPGIAEPAAEKPAAAKTTRRTTTTTRRTTTNKKAEE